MNWLIDASVIVAAYAESHNPSRKFLQKTNKKYILSLTHIEVGNALLYKNVVHSYIEAVLEAIQSQDFQTYDVSLETVKLASQIAYQYNTTLYDATYVAAAVQNDMKMVTLDRKLYRKITTLNRVILITE